MHCVVPTSSPQSRQSPDKDPEPAPTGPIPKKDLVNRNIRMEQQIGSPPVELVHLLSGSTTPADKKD